MAKLIKKKEYKGLDYFLFECKVELFTYLGTSMPGHFPQLFTIILGVDVIGRVKGRKTKAIVPDTVWIRIPIEHFAEAKDGIEEVYTNRYPDCKLMFI